MPIHEYTVYTMWLVYNNEQAIPWYHDASDGTFLEHFVPFKFFIHRLINIMMYVCVSTLFKLVILLLNCFV